MAIRTDTKRLLLPDYRTADAEFCPEGFKPRTINTHYYEGIYTVTVLSKVFKSELAALPGVGPRLATNLAAPLKAGRYPQELDLTSRTVSVRFDASSLKDIDAWAADQPGITSRTEAVRRLVYQALAASAHKNR
jgi:hypothetical protein